MFKRHDADLSIVRKVTKVLLITCDVIYSIFLLVSAIMMISSGSSEAILTGIITIVIGIPLANAGFYFLWMTESLIFSFMYHIKLIRNKLYDENNNSLGLPLVVQHKKEDESNDIYSEIMKMKELLDAGIISDYEFTEMKKRFL